MKITGFSVFDNDGNTIDSDTHGNNIAFKCFECGHPVLAVALENQRGWDEDHPAKCKSENCNASYILDIRAHKDIMYVYSI